MAKRATKAKARTVTARVIGPVPHGGFREGEVLWQVRLIAPHFPFFLDSRVNYRTKADADEQAEKWRRRKVTITFTSK
jgi:hypothetical protein